MSRTIKALVLGDLIGQPGCRAVFIELNRLIKTHNADLVIVNGENADNGFGITPDIAEKLFSQGVDVITSGNHIWQKDAIYPFLDQNDRILRPANYPKNVPGKGITVVEKKGIRFGVLNLIGRINLVTVDCPFAVGRKQVSELKKQKSDIIIVDFHAEVTEEKEALSHFLDGSVSLVFGTHTHVQTADERILPKGTAYITDVGMTGPLNSVIGSEPAISIERSKTQLPLKMKVADNDTMINGIVCEFDPATGKALSIIRVNEKG